MVTATKVSPERFVLDAIDKLHTEKSKGIHSVIAGLNDALRAYFGGDPIELLKGLVTKGVIEQRPTKKGFMVYKKGDMPTKETDNQRKTDAVLAKILGN